MKLLNAVMASLAFLGGANVSAVEAGNTKSVIAFIGSMEIPGVHLAGLSVLPAGTYVFKILDAQADRHIVQIFNEEETTIYSTILTIPNYRLKASDKPVVTFGETPAGIPEALRAWFSPGRAWANEFVYPKAKALELAKSANMPVLFTPDALPVEVAVMKKAQIMAITPAGEELQIEAAMPPSPQVEAHSVPSAELAGLPGTSSRLSTTALMGLLAIGGLFALRSIEKSVR